MGSAPLPPLRNPLETLGELMARVGLALPNGSVTFLILALVLGGWFIYTLVVSYHWLRYSHASIVAYPALFVHLVVSLAIMSYILTGSIVPTTLL